MPGRRVLSILRSGLKSGLETPDLMRVPGPRIERLLTMRDESQSSSPIRATGLAATATTVLALAAMSAAASAAASTSPAPWGPVPGCRAEPLVVRAVAAAVAAAVRDLVGAERSMEAPALLVSAAEYDLQGGSLIRRERRTPVAIPRILDERLLDLPPPL